MRFARSPQPTDPTRPLGVLVVGFGYWGRNYVRVLNELPDAHVVAVCDQSPERLEAAGLAFPDLPITSGLDGVLGLRDLDVAVISTPAATHREVAEHCLRGGLSVLVEKPLATSSADAEDLIRIADANGLVLMTGHTFVYNAGVRKMKEYIASGAIGQLYYLYARRTSLGPIRDDVNALWDLVPHDVSIFNFLLDAEPQWVSAIGSSVLRSDHEDVGFITIGYPEGMIAHIHVSWADPKKTREVVAVGSEQRVVFNDLNPLERVRVFEKGVTSVQREASTYGEYSFLLRDGDIVSPVVEASEPLKNQCAHFIECVRSGERPMTDGYVGRNVVRVMEAIDRSVDREGAPIAVGSETEEVEGGRRRERAHAHTVR